MTIKTIKTISVSKKCNNKVTVENNIHSRSPFIINLSNEKHLRLKGLTSDII